MQIIIQIQPLNIPYFLNTAKVHTLFNASFDPSYWIVLNVKTVPETVDFVIKNVEFA